MLQGEKLENIKMEMIRLKIDILRVIEVRWPNNGDFWSNEFRIIYLEGDISGRAGIGFILNKKWGYQVIKKVTYSDRLALITLKAKPNNIEIIQIYIPTSNANDEVGEIYARIEKLIKLTKGEDNLIIMGDWNVRTLLLTDRSCL